MEAKAEAEKENNDVVDDDDMEDILAGVLTGFLTVSKQILTKNLTWKLGNPSQSTLQNPKWVSQQTINYIEFR